MWSPKYCDETGTTCATLAELLADTTGGDSCITEETIGTSACGGGPVVSCPTGFSPTGPLSSTECGKDGEDLRYSQTCTRQVCSTGLSDCSAETIILPSADIGATCTVNAPLGSHSQIVSVNDDRGFVSKLQRFDGSWTVVDNGCSGWIPGP